MAVDPHLTVFILSGVLLLMFVLYIYVYDHKVDVTTSSWEDEFVRRGLTPDQVADLSHDDTTWYYQRVSTCVGYGEKDDPCSVFENYCSGGSTAGTGTQQVQEVVRAIKKGGIHPDCPLVYQGT